MALQNEDRGQLVGAFIVEEGDEVLSITQAGQVVRSPINTDFRPTGRSTMGVKFVSPKSGDAVAVVARSVEARVEDEMDSGSGVDPVIEQVLEQAPDQGVPAADDPADDSTGDTADDAVESADSPPDATIDVAPDPGESES
jgi:DNA gyrase subunit A